MNISRSKAVNQAQLLKMKERDEYLLMMRQEMLTDLQELRTNDRERYMKTIRSLVL